MPGSVEAREVLAQLPASPPALLPEPRGPSPAPTMAQKPKVDPHVGRLGYLQALVTEFQETESEGESGRVGVRGLVGVRPQPPLGTGLQCRFSAADAKEQVLANLANFAYDPSNYQYLRQLQVLDLFLDSLSEENETLVEFAIGKDGPGPPDA